MPWTTKAVDVGAGRAHLEGPRPTGSADWGQGGPIWVEPAHFPPAYCCLHSPLVPNHGKCSADQLRRGEEME